jgi:hypothetical protein
MLLDDRLKCYWVIAMHGNMHGLNWLNFERNLTVCTRSFRIPLLAQRKERIEAAKAVNPSRWGTRDVRNCTPVVPTTSNPEKEPTKELENRPPKSVNGDNYLEKRRERVCTECGFVVVK